MLTNKKWFDTSKVVSTMKIPIMGEAYVGKTTIANVLSGGGYVKDYKMTVGVDIFMRYVYTKKGVIRIQLWDLAGQKRFSFLRKIFYKGSHAAIFMFDLTRLKTFQELDAWIKDFLHLHPGTPIVIVGNKKDLCDKREIDRSLGEALARKYGTVYIETSAKTNENVEAVIQYLLSEIAKKHAVISL